MAGILLQQAGALFAAGLTTLTAIAPTIALTIALTVPTTHPTIPLKAMKPTKFLPVLLALTCLVPTLAHAHAETGAHAGFGSGWAHPLHGLDHLLAMVAVGLWAAQRGGRFTWALPVSFVSFMMGGFLLSMTGMSLPLVELGIGLSVVALGILVAFSKHLTLSLSAGIVGLFALFHGFAHGTELPDGASPFTFLAGFAIATALLHAAGVGAALMLSKFKAPQLVRAAGAAICLTGIVLLAS